MVWPPMHISLNGDFLKVVAKQQENKLMCPALVSMEVSYTEKRGYRNALLIWSDLYVKTIIFYLNLFCIFLV